MLSTGARVGELIGAVWRGTGDGLAKLQSMANSSGVNDRQREPQRRLAGRTKDTSALLLPGGRRTAHDLRRTAATLMAGLGISGEVIDECLNHIIESRVRRTYIRDRRDAEQARAFDALGARLQALTTAKQATKSLGRKKSDSSAAIQRPSSQRDACSWTHQPP
jgi:hypothetical protein